MTGLRPPHAANKAGTVQGALRGAHPFAIARSNTAFIYKGQLADMEQIGSRVELRSRSSDPRRQS
jgi:hypothetical protein